MTHEIFFDFDIAGAPHIDASATKAIDANLTGEIIRAVADSAASTALRDEADYGVYLDTEPNPTITDQASRA